MKRIWLYLALLFVPVVGYGQTAAIQNHCFLGGTAAKTSGLNSSNYLNGIIPHCTVTVYLTGTLTKATIYSSATSTPLANPFFSNTLSSVNPGGWIFWAAVNQGYDIVMSGGDPPNTYSQPVTLVDQFPGSSFSGTPTVVEVNSTPISPASPANFADTSSVTWSFTGGQIQATAAGSAPIGTQYKVGCYNGAGSGSSTALGQCNYTTDATGNPLTVPGALTGLSIGNQSNALMYQTSPGSNDGLANAEAAAGANGTTFAPSNYATTEAPGFAAPSNTIVTDYRAGTRIFQHNSITLDEGVDFAGKQQSNCLVDGSLSTSNYNCGGVNSYFFGPGIDIGNGAVTTHQALFTNYTSYTPGIQSPSSGEMNFYAVGDSNRYDYCNYVGGWFDGGGEGVNCFQRHTTEAPNMFTGTVTTGGAGAAAVMVSPTSAGSGGSAGGNGQYTGGMLLNLTQVTDSGNVTLNTYGVPQVLTTDTTHTASTVYCTTSASTPDPGNWPNGAAESFTCTTPSAGSFAPGDEFCFGGPGQWEESSVTSVAGSAGAQTITANMTLPQGPGGLVVKGKCQAITFDADKIAGLMDPPYLVIGAPTTTSYWVGYYSPTGRDNVILSGANSAAITPVPQAMSSVTRTSNVVTATLVPSDQVTPMNDFTTVITGCADSSFDGTVTPSVVPQDPNNGSNFAEMSYVLAGANGTTTGCSASLVGLNGYHVYPMAKVVDVADPTVVGTKPYLQQPTLAIDGYFRLGHNAVNWSASDSLEEPHPSSVLSGDDSSFSTQNSPGPSSSYSIQHYWLGRGQTGSYLPLHLQNEVAPAKFRGLGGTLPPINAFANLSAVANTFLYFPFAPINGGALISVACPPAASDDPNAIGSNCGSTTWYRVFENGGTGIGGKFYFQPSTSSYQLNAINFNVNAALHGTSIDATSYTLKFNPSGSTIFTFDNSAQTPVNAFQSCFPYDSVGELDLGLHCNQNGMPVSQPDGWLNAGLLTAAYGASLNATSIGLPLPTVVPVLAVTGGGSTSRQYYFVGSNANGTDGAYSLPTPTGTRFGNTAGVNAAATLDGSHYVTITCPSALQPTYPSGSSYTVLTDGPEGTRRLGTCPLGSNLVDNGGGTVETRPGVSWNGVIGAGDYGVGYNGALEFLSNNTGTAVFDTFITRGTASGQIKVGTTHGASNGDIEAATWNGKGVCASDGTGCVAITPVLVALPTTAIAANTCTAPVAVTMTGVVGVVGSTPGSRFTSSWASDPSAATGWGSSGGLSINMWPTTNTLNWEVCNPTASSITPGAMSINVGAQ